MESVIRDILIWFAGFTVVSTAYLFVVFSLLRRHRNRKNPIPVDNSPQSAQSDKASGDVNR